MKILYVASEALPYASTGGLADVLGSLPIAVKKSLGDQGDVRVAQTFGQEDKQIGGAGIRRALVRVNGGSGRIRERKFTSPAAFLLSSHDHRAAWRGGVGWLCVALRRPG